MAFKLPSLRRPRASSVTVEELREKLLRFRDLVERNDRVLELIADAGEKLGGEYIFDRPYLEGLARSLRSEMHGVVQDLNALSQNRYAELFEVLGRIDREVEAALEGDVVVPTAPLVIPMADVGTEHAEIAGQKMARLGEVGARLGCHIPDGFVVTTFACHRFLEETGLLGEVEDARRLLARRPDLIPSRLTALQQRIREASLPTGLQRALQRELSRLKKSGATLFAVRSSATAEDGERSFAGQFTTVLGVEAERVAEAYKEVVASLFSPAVGGHRGRGGPLGELGAMAVGVLCMVPTRASGVTYTLDPLAPADGVQVVTAALGLGRMVVEGGGAVDRFRLSRSPGFPVRERKIGRKERRYVASPGRGVVLEEVPAEVQRDAAVTDAELARIGEASCAIERYMRCAQDVEWAIDEEGELIILQARPLRLASPPPAVDRAPARLAKRYEVLLEGRGEVACRGIGSGRVFKITSPADLHEHPPPPGSVLVARAAAPWLGPALREASAVVTDLGTPTGHFAAVAREYRVPTVVGTEVGFSLLPEGEEVTLDAEALVVYRGRVEELVEYQLLARPAYEDEPEFRTLRRMLRKVAPLNLTDPQAPGFSAAACRSYHDVLRFAHEKAVGELTEVGRVKPSAGAGLVRPLVLPIPLDLLLIDLGGGIAGPAGAGPVELGEVTSRPLAPLLDQLVTTGAWETSPAEMDLHGFMSSATRTMSPGSPMAATPEQNLAIVSEDYTHLSLKLGYHFNIVDSYATETPADNYVYFRFAGGVTEPTRRSRRARLLRRILEEYDFVVEGRGDLVVARLKAVPLATMTDRLGMIGRLIGFTRQLDIFLKSDALVDEYVGRFLSGWPARTSEPKGSTRG